MTDNKNTDLVLAGSFRYAKKFVRLEDQRVRGADGSKYQHQSQDRGTYKRQYKARHCFQDTQPHQLHRRYGFVCFKQTLKQNCSLL